MSIVLTWGFCCLQLGVQEFIYQLTSSQQQPPPVVGKADPGLSSFLQRNEYVCYLAASLNASLTGFEIAGVCVFHVVFDDAPAEAAEIVVVSGDACYLGKRPDMRVKSAALLPRTAESGNPLL